MTTGKRIAALMLVVVTVAAAVAVAEPSLVGDQIIGTGNWQVSPSPSTNTVVDPGVEFTTLWFTTDFSSSAVLATMIAGSYQNFGGGTITFSDLDFTPATSIIGITNFDASATCPVILGDVSFTSNSVTIINQGGWQPGDWYSFSFVTDYTPPVMPGTLIYGK